MKITERKIKVADVFNGYFDSDGYREDSNKFNGVLEKYYNSTDPDGVYAFGGKLVVRPAYQREFIYKDQQRNAVIDTVFKGFPLNTMYWSDNGDGTYELMDGQQRTLSICQYLNKEFSIKLDGNATYWQSISGREEGQDFLNYELTVYVCSGTEKEKLDWFRTINIAGEKLTDQELLNAVYTGTWLADAKKHFSKKDCVASKVANGYIKGNPIRQEILEKVLSWIADRDGLENGENYMAKHQYDEDANELWQYYNEVISWAQRLFPTSNGKGIKGITDCQNWGILYNRYHNNSYNSNKLMKELNEFIIDDEVTNKKGIIPYLLSAKTPHDERNLSIRSFTDAQKKKAYIKQNGVCPCCGQHFDLDQMEGDHIIPWSLGGKTTDDNLHMLCRNCNNDKRDK